MKKILITGSKGFIGTALRSTLARNSIQFIEFEGDLSNIKDIEKVFLAHKFHTIVHLAGYYGTDAEKQFQVNVVGTHNLLNIASISGVSKIIFASTGAVYGNNHGSPSSETDICAPSNYYGHTKLLAESEVQYFFSSVKKNCIILRFPNVYGPNSKGVISSFLRSIHEKKYIDIYGNGLQKRDFLYITDAVRSIMIAMDKTHISGIFNISSSLSLTINQLVDELAKHHDFTVNRYSENDNTLQYLLLDTQKATKILGFTSVVNSLSLHHV